MAIHGGGMRGKDSTTTKESGILKEVRELI